MVGLALIWIAGWGAGGIVNRSEPALNFNSTDLETWIWVRDVLLLFAFCECIADVGAWLLGLEKGYWLAGLWTNG